MADILRLVELQPVKPCYSGKGNKYPAIAWFRNVKISRHLDQNAIDRIIKDLHTKKTVQTINNPDNVLYWQYPQRPLIIIDRNEEQPKIKTTDGTIAHYGLNECMKEASTVLEILRSYGFAKYKRVIVSTYRLGDSKEQREFIFKCLEERLKNERS
jgi:undecaprenyl pyrophosphate synthase